MTVKVKKNGRIDIGKIRREQIVEAAVAVIAEQGLQHLSLSEIETKVGMSRGQLTYYFRTKEAILLAVFDHLVHLMTQQQGQNGPVAWEPASWQEVVRVVLGKILREPPAHPEFGCLQHTFLSQIGHREDYRRRLANLYEGWRSHLALLLRGSSKRRFSARTVASLIQAIFHGVAMQVAADPDAFDRAEMTNLCLDLLNNYLTEPVPKNSGQRARPGRNSRLHANGVNHE